MAGGEEQKDRCQDDRDLKQALFAAAPDKEAFARPTERSGQTG